MRVVTGLIGAWDLVDAPLVGFDRREAVTIPAVPDVAAWEVFEQARGVLVSGFSNSKPAALTDVRYASTQLLNLPATG
jgi:hypothetical protein